MKVDLDNDTSEGAQELQPRKGMKAEELLRELGCVLRMSEADAADLARDPGDDETMIINMGPQHPSTHGVLRLMLELDGETVLRTKPIIGYLHTGMEKTGEDLTFLQGPTNVTRMDYASPLFNELVFSMATEKLLGIEDEIPPRAQWIRMLMTRDEPHLLPRPVPGHQRHGHRRDRDDAVRLARARRGVAVLREGHRAANEPQLHPAGGSGRRSARRLA